MRSTRTHLIDLANTRNGMIYALAFASFVVLMPLPVKAMVIAPSTPLQQQLKQELMQDNLVTEVRARAGGSARRTTVVGPRGNAASRTVVRGGAVARPGVARPGGWVRPAHYYWRPGGAIAAGAAIGFVAAASAAAYAGSPPAPGYCWYYSDPGKTQGFWDVCP